MFFKKIINLGLKVKIYGIKWNKDKNYNFLKPHIVMGHVKDPRYSKLIYNSKIALCLPSVSNNDDITKKSIFFEQQIMKEVVGSQDQMIVTRGSFNKITFKKNNQFKFIKKN